MDELLVIHVVEDQSLIRDDVEETLDDSGFEVVLATSGEEATKLVDSSDPKYCALVADINLDRDSENGWEVVTDARSVVPELAVVCMTGDSAAEWASQGVPNTVRLTKPFAPAQLVTTVAQFLKIIRIAHPG